MRARTALGSGQIPIQYLGPRTEIGHQVSRDLAEYNAKRYGSVTQMIDWSELELRTLAAAGISVEDFLRL